MSYQINHCSRFKNDNLIMAWIREFTIKNLESPRCNSLSILHIFATESKGSLGLSPRVKLITLKKSVLMIFLNDQTNLIQFIFSGQKSQITIIIIYYIVKIFWTEKFEMLSPPSISFKNLHVGLTVLSSLKVFSTSEFIPFLLDNNYTFLNQIVL